MRPDLEALNRHEVLPDGTRVLLRPLRPNDAALYPQWYGFEHPRPGAWEYAIPELFPPQGSLVACPAREIAVGAGLELLEREPLEVSDVDRIGDARRLFADRQTG